MNRNDNAKSRWTLGRRDFLKAAAAFPAALTSARFSGAAPAIAGSKPGAVAADGQLILPPGVRAVWDLATAHRDSTPTRERICINGLWRWRPAESSAGSVPDSGWGYFKVPGCWPGFTDYMQKESQALHVHPDWKGVRLREVSAAWQQREISIPQEWSGWKIFLSAECVNSLATIYVDGKAAGAIRFPGGEADITEACRPGARHTLSLFVEAAPLQAVLRSYIDTANAREVKGSVARRGLCGDVFLVAAPAGARISDVKIDTSVRKGEIALAVALQGLDAGKRYCLSARITEDAREITQFQGAPFSAGDVHDGRIEWSQKWKPEKLWDIHTPQNQYELQVTLQEDGGATLDAALPIRFGFREFWIEGRDFYLNGSRIFLSCVPIDNAQVSAHMVSYARARETLARLKSFGINAVYTHNYGCQPGDHLGFAEILRAADDEGVLVSFSQPHFSHYDWKSPDADAKNGYARHAEYYVRMAQNHPAVVMYSMSHNATGYNGDMDPDLIDGKRDARDTWALKNCALALRAETIVRLLDPGRIVYHHAGGNIGAMHTINFYPNFVPVQELSDWYGHWAAEGVKPVFMCEYGAPFTWDWAMYRGWYKGERTFGSARVPWEFCLAEWNAQFFGDRAFRISEAEKANLRWEAKKFQAGQTWFRWDYPHQLGSSDFPERDAVWAMYLRDNWRAFRTWGVSANSPWEYSILWRLRPGVDKGRRELPVDWGHLQRPGFSADFEADCYEKIDMAYDRSDWLPGAGAQALIDNNRPLLAYIAGKAERFTSKHHNFLPGETVEKQVVVINNSRQAVTCDCEWSFGPGPSAQGAVKAHLETGEITRLPFRFKLPSEVAAGACELRLKATFSTGEVQQDSALIHVLAPPSALRPSALVALFDTKGETARLLEGLGVAHHKIDAKEDLGAYELLIIGKDALSVDGPAPDLTGVRDGLKVIVFEQTSAALERRLGFRVQEYGLRQVFRRLQGHPALDGLSDENLRDWRGEATILPPRLKLQKHPRYGATVKWCDIPVTRLWRCGNQGSVASVLLEKPACGNFLPLVDGGFSLQYSPLLEYREGKGMALFCQMDVTGRTENDPAAERLVRNLLQYASEWKPAPARKAVYVGEPAGKAHLKQAGFAPTDFDAGSLADGQVLVVGPGGGKQLAAHRAKIGAWLQSGGRLLALGLDAGEANAFLPHKIGSEQREHIAACFEPQAAGSLLAGVGPADVHNRAPRELPLISSGALTLGDGVLARSENDAVVFCQLLPWRFDAKNQGQKRTFRRTSCLVGRLLGNMGAAGATPLLERFGKPVAGEGSDDRRWLQGLYLDEPEEWDDPYRAFRW